MPSESGAISRENHAVGRHGHPVDRNGRSDPMRTRSIIPLQWMRTRLPSLLLIIILLSVSGCTQPEDALTPGQKNSEKTIHLQESVTDYSATVEELLQDGGPTITRDILIRRPYMYRVVDSDGCHTLSDGYIRWSYCTGSATATYFEDPSVRGFFNDLDYQQIFTNMLVESPGTMVGNGTIGGSGTWIIDSTPAPGRYHLRYTWSTVRLWIDMKTGMILRAEFIPDDTTNVGIIRFHNVTVNRGIPDTVFTFVPDPGMELINQKAGRFTENLEGKSGYSQEATPCTDCPLPIRTPLQ